MYLRSSHSADTGWLSKGIIVQDSSSFVLFSPIHLITVAIIFLIAVFFALLVKNLHVKIQSFIGRCLAWTLIIVESFKFYYRMEFLGEPWQDNLPFHFCGLSMILLAYTIFTRTYKTYEIVYFWAFVGAVMALITPDVPASFPHPEYLLYFVGHGMIIVGIFFVTYMYDFRPQVSSIWESYKAALSVLVIIFPLNYILGGEANYLYLRFRPDVGSLMNFMPEPPFHIPFLMIIAYIFFWVVYLPYWIKDLMPRKQGNV